MIPIYSTHMTRLIFPHSTHLLTLPLAKNQDASCLPRDVTQSNIQSSHDLTASYVPLYSFIYSTIWASLHLEHTAPFSHIRKSPYTLCQAKMNFILQIRYLFPSLMTPSDHIYTSCRKLTTFCLAWWLVRVCMFRSLSSFESSESPSAKQKAWHTVGAQQMFVEMKKERENSMSW